MRKYSYVALVAVLPFISACTTNTPTPNAQLVAQNQSLANSGQYTQTTQGVTYINNQLNMVVNLPSTWKAIDREGLQQLTQDENAAILAKVNNPAMASYVQKQLQENKVRLFAAYQPSVVGFSSLVSVSATRKGVFDPTNIEELRKQVIYIAKNDKIPHETANANFPLANIGGKKFVRLHIESYFTEFKQTLYQDIYTTPVENDYYLRIAFVYRDQKDSRLLPQVLSGIRFTS